MLDGGIVFYRLSFDEATHIRSLPSDSDGFYLMACSDLLYQSHVVCSKTRDPSAYHLFDETTAPDYLRQTAESWF